MFRNGLPPLGDDASLAQELPFHLGSVDAAGAAKQQFPTTCSVDGSDSQIHASIKNDTGCSRLLVASHGGARYLYALARTLSVHMSESHAVFVKIAPPFWREYRRWLRRPGRETRGCDRATDDERAKPRTHASR